MKHDLISIIVPVYNVEPYLEKCLNSICNQTYKNLDVVLVDDGSTDASGGICDAFAQNDGRIKVLHQNNSGVSGARNAGISAAEGDYIIFVDSDDWIEQDMIEYMYEGIVRTCAQIAVCGAHIVKHGKSKTWSQNEESMLTRDQALKELSRNGRIKNYLWSMMTARPMMKGIVFPEGKIFEDILTIYQILEKADKIVLLPGAKYNYRKRPGSISYGKNRKANLGRCYAHEVRYKDMAVKYPELVDELLCQFFYMYRKTARENIKPYVGEEACEFQNRRAFFIQISDRLYVNESVTRLERKELDILRRYEGGFSLGLLCLEAIRIVSSRLRVS